MATLAAGITYEMKRVQFTTSSGTYSTVLDLPAASTDKLIFINQIMINSESGSAGQAQLQRTQILTGSISLGRQDYGLGQSNSIGTVSVQTKRQDFFTYKEEEPVGLSSPGDIVDWRLLYPGDRIQFRASGTPSGSIVIFYTEVKFKGQFELL